MTSESQVVKKTLKERGETDSKVRLTETTSIINFALDTSQGVQRRPASTMVSNCTQGTGSNDLWFMDDVIMMSYGDECSVSLICEWSSKFGEASGLKLVKRNLNQFVLAFLSMPKQNFSRYLVSS